VRKLVRLRIRGFRYTPADLCKIIEIQADGLMQINKRRIHDRAITHRLRILLSASRRLLAMFPSKDYSLVTCFDPSEPPTHRVRHGLQRAGHKANWPKYRQLHGRYGKAQMRLE